jgi:hypothetical protein
MGFTVWIDNCGYIHGTNGYDDRVVVCNDQGKWDTAALCGGNNCCALRGGVPYCEC